MSMAIDPKKAAMIVVSRMKPSGDVESLKNANQKAFSERSGMFETPAEGPKEGKLAAAEEMIQAFHAKDADGLVTALESFLDLTDEDEAGDAQEDKPSLD